MKKEQFEPQEGIDWYNKLIRDFNAKDAQIAALRAALIEARGWVQDEVNTDRRHRGQDVLDRIDAALSGSPAPTADRAMRDALMRAQHDLAHVDSPESRITARARIDAALEMSGGVL